DRAQAARGIAVEPPVELGLGHRAISPRLAQEPEIVLLVLRPIGPQLVPHAAGPLRLRPGSFPGAAGCCARGACPYQAVLGCGPLACPLCQRHPSSVRARTYFVEVPSAALNQRRACVPATVSLSAIRSQAPDSTSSNVRAG